MSPDPLPDLPVLVMGLLGGLALFLFGLEQMTVALKTVAGSHLRTILARLTSRRITALLTGALVTAVIQSSSVTTVLVVGFISSGLMSLSQSVGVILGANIGTTVTAQIIAFKVTKIALALVAVGFGIAFFTKQEKLRHHGNGILGLGLVFLGMTVMGEAMAPLRSYPPFIAWMVQMEHPALGILAGALFTGLVQSSSATTGVVIAMASQGLLSLTAGIALVFGANVGTCVTALLASIGKPREAVRAAMVHVLFNVAGVLLWLGFIDELARLVASFSPRFPDLAGTDRLAAETPRQIANAHTAFNIANGLIFLPLSATLATIVERLVPDRPLAVENEIRARYLDEALLATPTLALQRVRRELGRLGEHVAAMLEAGLPAVLTGESEDLQKVAAMDEDINRLYDQIVGYLARAGQAPLGSRETEEFIHLMTAANCLESIGDIIDKDLVSRGRQRLVDGIEIAAETAKVIEEFHAEIVSALRNAALAVKTEEPEVAQSVVALKPKIRQLADRVSQRQSDRLVARRADRLSSYALEKDIVEDLRRVYYFAKRMARSAVRLGKQPAEVRTRPDRPQKAADPR
jgi:phosphate:Na+ symporter